MSAVTVRALEPADWPVLERLFGARGACGGCWCMAWRLVHKEWEARRGEPNRRAMRALVQRGEASGVLALAGDEPLGWCSVGPRADFTGLERKWSLATDWDERTWSVTCFFVRREHRGEGLGRRLLAEAVRIARDHGASRIEGYPVANRGADGRPLPGSFIWTGVPSLFEACGFRALPNPPGKRPIYVRRLRAKKA